LLAPGRRDRRAPLRPMSSIANGTDRIRLHLEKQNGDTSKATPTCLTRSPIKTVMLFLWVLCSIALRLYSR